MPAGWRPPWPSRWGAAEAQGVKKNQEKTKNAWQTSPKAVNAKAGSNAAHTRLGNGGRTKQRAHTHPTGVNARAKTRRGCAGERRLAGADACQARWAGGGSRAANGQRTCWAVKGSAPCGAMAPGSAGGCGWRAGACASPASSAWVRHQTQVVCVSSL